MDLLEQTGQAELLTITDPFEQTVQTRFLAAADFSLVDKIIVMRTIVTRRMISLMRFTLK
jgi:hypothetical protein